MGPSPGCQELAQKPHTACRLATVTLLVVGFGLGA